MSNKSTKKSNKEKEVKKTKVKIEEKSSKKKKESSEKSKDEKRNNATLSAKLQFNVKVTQRWLKKFFDNERYYVVKKVKNEEEKDDKKKTKKVKDVKNTKKPKEGTEEEEKNESYMTKVKILYAHFAITAADQVMCLHLVNVAGKKSKKGEAGLYTITEDNMLDAIKDDRDMKYTFSRYLDNYASQDDYTSQMNMKKEDVTNFIEKFSPSGGNVKIDQGAFNVLMFVMYKNRIQLIETAFHMVVFAGKSSVNDKAVMQSIKTIHVGDLANTMYKKVEDTSKIVRHLNIESTDSDEKKGSKDSSDEKNSKDSDGPKKKNGKSVKKRESSDSESDKSESDGGTDSEGEESRNESEEESDSS